MGSKKGQQHLEDTSTKIGGNVLKPKQTCTHIKVTFTLDGSGIKTIINSFLNDISHKKWCLQSINNRGSGVVNITSEAQLTRKMIEARIRDRFKEYGVDGCEREEDKRPEFAHIDWDEQKEKAEELIAERESLVDKLATKLFPDWFPPPNSIKLIQSLKKAAKLNRANK